MGKALSGCDPQTHRKAGPAELTFRHGEGEFPRMEVPDSLSVVLIGSQAPLKGLSCAVPSRGCRALSGLVSKRRERGVLSWRV